MKVWLAACPSDLLMLLSLRIKVAFSRAQDRIKLSDRFGHNHENVIRLLINGQIH
jgi:hypothetical protein